MSSATSIYWELKVNNILIDGAKRACINSIEFDELCDGSDTCTLQININEKDKKYKVLTFKIAHDKQLSLSNIKMYSDCLYTRGAARVQNYSTYLSKLSDILL